MPTAPECVTAEPSAPSGECRADGTDTGDVVVRAAALSKTFRIYPRPWGRLTEWLTLGRAVRHEDFHALRDVNFEVARGESLGVIGLNGSGKSTLLKILSGALYPTAGTFHVTGRTLSLLELGTGLSPDLTGRQNVINSSLLLGFPGDYASRKMGAIEAFAELAEFFDRPVRLYSSGMLVRLVFSMFACFDPEVFIVDEALSVGDVHFQQKCARRIRQLLDGGVTMLFVSHDLAAVEALCDRVMVLHQGTVRFLGDKQQGIRLYYSLVGATMPAGAAATAGTPSGSGEAPVRPAIQREPELGEAGAGLAGADPDSLLWQAPDLGDATGDGSVRITGVCCRTEDGRFGQVVRRGEWVEVFVRYEAAEDVGPMNAAVNVYDRLNQLLFAVSWLNAEVEPLWLARGQRAAARFALKADLEPGEYVLYLGASEALAEAQGWHGWNQDVGGRRFAALPRAIKLAVLPPADHRRRSFGPANLQYALGRTTSSTARSPAAPPRDGSPS